MARNKLHAAIGGKDNCNLHRWVLLKNSVFRSQSPSTPSLLNGPPSSVCVCSEGVADDEEDGGELEESDSFMFPDASKLIPQSDADMTVSEAEWLDSLLETLCDDEQDEFCASPDVPVSVAVEEDDDTPLSPLTSPMSSSDDLLNQQAHCSPSAAVSYPVPYPPFHPPLALPYELGPVIESPLISPPPAYVALSRCDMDELDDLSVPEAIEDISDDESDAPSTPSLGRSSHFFFGPSLSEGRRQQPELDVYIRTAGSVFDRFELDPLPFPDEDNLNSYNVYEEC